MRLGFLVLMGLVGAAPAFADEPVRTGAAAFGDWRTDAPGVRRLITPADLPAPFATSSTANMPRDEARTGGEIPKAPSGFTVEPFATGLNTPRVIRVAPNGDIFVAETGAGSVRVFHPGASSGPAKSEIFASGLQRPYGIAFYPSGSDPKFVYVASPDSVLRFPYRNGDVKASGPAEKIASLPGGGGHWTRDLAFSPDDKTLYVSVGSSSNDAEGLRAMAARVLGASWGEEQLRADVLAFDPDGKDMSALSTQPAFAIVQALCGSARNRQALWCAVNERDGLGDDLPPDAT